MILFMILDQKSSGSRPDRTTENQPLTMKFVGGFLFLAKKGLNVGKTKKNSHQKLLFILPIILT
jgi:hypothetical protein